MKRTNVSQISYLNRPHMASVVRRKFLFKILHFPQKTGETQQQVQNGRRSMGTSHSEVSQKMIHKHADNYGFIQHQSKIKKFKNKYTEDERHQTLTSWMRNDALSLSDSLRLLPWQPGICQHGHDDYNFPFVFLFAFENFLDCNKLNQEHNYNCVSLTMNNKDKSVSKSRQTEQLAEKCCCSHHEQKRGPRNPNHD